MTSIKHNNDETIFPLLEFIPSIDYSNFGIDKLREICRNRGIKNLCEKKEDIASFLQSVSCPVYKNKAKNAKRVASLFCGCGGLDYGFVTNPLYKVIYANDNDMEACRTYEHNYGIKTNCSDICTVTKIPDCDIVIGEFQCSHLNETYKPSAVLAKIIDLLAKKSPQPHYIIFVTHRFILSSGGYENATMRKSKTGRHFSGILKKFTDIGYKMSFDIVKFERYDIPQHRERVIIFGVHNGVEFSPCLDKPNKNRFVLSDAIGDLPLEYDYTKQHIGMFGGRSRHKHCDLNLCWNETPKCLFFTDGATIDEAVYLHPCDKRKLTIRECARIQTFPDDFKFCGSMKSMYRQVCCAFPCAFSIRLSKMFETAP